MVRNCSPNINYFYNLYLPFCKIYNLIIRDFGSFLGLVRGVSTWFPPWRQGWHLGFLMWVLKMKSYIVLYSLWSNNSDWFLDGWKSTTLFFLAYVKSVTFIGSEGVSFFFALQVKKNGFYLKKKRFNSSGLGFFNPAWWRI